MQVIILLFAVISQYSRFGLVDICSYECAHLYCDDFFLPYSSSTRSLAALFPALPESPSRYLPASRLELCLLLAWAQISLYPCSKTSLTVHLDN